MSNAKNPNARYNWAEYATPEGRKYYFNRVTGVTTWEKPNELKSAAELVLASNWKEYIADNGRKYYYNSVTQESVWEEPSELKAIREAQEKGLLSPQSPPMSPATPTLAPKPDQTSPPMTASPGLKAQQQEDSRTYEERVEVFKTLLEFAGVQSTWNWDTTMRAIINDERYKVLPTLAEKKKVLAEFQQDKRRQEKEEKRKKDEKSREQFIQMLKECDRLKPNMTWRKALGYFEGDMRIDLVPERDREDIFLQYLYDMEKSQKEAIKQARKDNLRKFRQKLEEDKSINVETQWRTVKAAFANEPSFQALDKNDRLSVFQEYIRDLERDEEEMKRTEAIGKKRQSRKVRDNFRQLLNDKYTKGEITYKSKWKEIQHQIRDDPRYKDMIAPDQIGSLPSELFGDFIDDIEERYYKDKKKLKEILKDLNMEPEKNKTMKFDEFIQALEPHSKFVQIAERHHKFLYDDFMDKATKEDRKKEKEEEKKRRKIREKFFDLLAERHIKPTAKWEEVRASLAESSAFQGVPSEEDRIKLFNDFIHKDDSSEEEGRIRSSSPDRRKHSKKSKKDKKHKHHKRHRDDPSSSDEKDKRRKKEDNNSNDNNERPRRNSSEEEGEMKV
mmetsp:Transcript_268/g.363  ORF Transcript_268/g.363 Transcript_268/m.363 type:complete len:615 (-) Transcript_268:7-1851(-)